MMFSTGVKLAGLDDFIAPSQECIKPVESEMPVKSIGKRGEIRVDSAGGYSEVDKDGFQVPLRKAKITLNDCLACSGCVTTAETMLIEQQSHSQLVNRLRSKEVGEIVCVTICPQTVASMASFYSTSMSDMTGRIVTFLKKMGCDYVFDSNFGRNFSLIESAEEFVGRIVSTGDEKTPLFTSACPGWICYAEKTHGDFILPHISRVKSPQQVMGTLIKICLSKSLSVSPDKIYHCCIMPCYDKKLEASRNDFSTNGIPDVDCVIATNELLVMLTESSVSQSYSNIEAESFDCVASLILGRESCKYDVNSHPGSGSGGYLEYVFRVAAAKIYGVTHPELSYVVKRGGDFQEIFLKVNEEIKLRFALAYGFKNLGNCAMKLKRKHLNYDYVEIMACPSGCLNGGGQLRPESLDNKSHLSSVTQLYKSLPASDPPDHHMVEELRQFLRTNYSNESLFYTQYHAIPKTVNPLNIKW